MAGTLPEEQEATHGTQNYTRSHMQGPHPEAFVRHPICEISTSSTRLMHSALSIVSEEIRAALENASEQFALSPRLFANAQSSRCKDFAGERAATESRVPTEKCVDDKKGFKSGGHIKYLQAEFSQQKRQMQRTDQQLAGLGDALGQWSPGDEETPFYTDTHSVTPHAHSTCPNNCRCACHGTRNYGSMSMPWLSSALGSVLVSYHGFVFWKTACTDSACLASRSKVPRWVKASYTLPPWLVLIGERIFRSARALNTRKEVMDHWAMTNYAKVCIRYIHVLIGWWVYVSSLLK